MSAPLLALEDCNQADGLTSLLSTLFEPSPVLRDLLVPSVLLRLTARSPASTPKSYHELVDICADVAKGWTWEQKADFLSGHPMIGEVNNLSALSGKEQGGATPKVVLDRLAYLNDLYCTLFPGLRFITFVNGRSRAQIIPEFETTCGLPVSPQPLPDDFPVDQPPIETVKEKLLRPAESEAWCVECERGMADVWAIAKARLTGMGLQ